MSRQDMKAKYGQQKNTKQLLNAAIRAECPGGNEALDAATAMAGLESGLDRLPRSVEADDFATKFRGVLVRVRRVVDAMAQTIRERYELWPGGEKPGERNDATEPLNDEDAPWLNNAPSAPPLD